MTDKPKGFLQIGDNEPIEITDFSVDTADYSDVYTMSPKRKDVMTDEPRYKVTYYVQHHAKGMTEREVLALDRGGCDSLIVISQLYPEDGSYSQAVASINGETGESVDENEVWKAWTALAHSLMDSDELSEGKRLVCKLVHEMVRDAVLTMRGKEDK
jgi:hypothetical protein